MQIGDLVTAWAISDHKRYIGVVTAIVLDHPYKKNIKIHRYKVFFPNAPHDWWNEGTWNKKALELL